MANLSLAPQMRCEDPILSFSEALAFNNFSSEKASDLAQQGNQLHDDLLQNLIDVDRSIPNQLEMLITLCKLYLSRGDTEKAEEMVFQTLIKASLLGGFSHIWSKLTATCADWNKPIGPARVFLHSLKVLGIIRMRQKDYKDAKEIFTVISRLDKYNKIKAKGFSSRLALISGEPCNE